MNHCKAYLEQLRVQLQKGRYEKVLCTSDIIESYFGKIKSKIKSSSRSGLTEFIFVLATFGQSFSIAETNLALQAITCKQFKTKLNETTIQQRTT